MNTVTYNYVLERACELTGRVYPPQTEEEPAFRGFIAQALRKIWEKFPWPDTISVEKVYVAQPWDTVNFFFTNAGTAVYLPYDGNVYMATVFNEGNPPISGIPGISIPFYAGYWFQVQRFPTGNSDWVSTTTYNAGDIVRWNGNGKIYICYLSPAAGINPSNTNYWFEITPYQYKFNKLTSYDGTTRTTQFGEILDITTSDPRESGGLTHVGFSIVGDDVILDQNYGMVYVTYRQVPPGLSTPPSTIPYRFSEYVSQKAAATMLLVDGKIDAAAAVAGLADDTLNDECDKVSNQEGLIRKTSVFTR